MLLFDLVKHNETVLACLFSMKKETLIVFEDILDTFFFDDVKLYIQDQTIIQQIHEEINKVRDLKLHEQNSYWRSLAKYVREQAKACPDMSEHLPKGWTND